MAAVVVPSGLWYRLENESMGGSFTAPGWIEGGVLAGKASAPGRPIPNRTVQSKGSKAAQKRHLKAAFNGESPCYCGESSGGLANGEESNETKELAHESVPARVEHYPNHRLPWGRNP